MTSLTMFLQPPTMLMRSIDAQIEQETMEIVVTQLLLKSYYDIVHKNIQDVVTKAIMHFLVSWCNVIWHS
jgi:dynamin 1-like protein